ncbi:MAG TPA: riboflavin biosynthesis protein RibF [Holophaga sp.]|nr:riboflavin biosynthesis protein RibF [Holophaga sp.]
MQVWHHTLEAAPIFGPSVVTLGVFDGVHAGHKAILVDAAARARKRGVSAGVVTFDPHPAVIVAPQNRPKLLMTLPQRLTVFERTGMDLAWVIPFSRTFSELSPAAFLEGLQRALSPVELHVGKAFHFGHDRAGDLTILKAWGARVGCEIHSHAFKAPDGGMLSSTRIREALEAGLPEEVAGLLGHPYVLSGIVVEGDRRGRHLGFPTANLAWEQEQLPANGVYVTEVRGGHVEGARLGVTNVGEKPTFDGLKLTVETFLPDFSADLYGGHLELGFLHRIRPERRFEGIEALRAQIAADVTLAQAWWEDRRRKTRH